MRKVILRIFTYNIHIHKAFFDHCDWLKNFEQPIRMLKTSIGSVHFCCNSSSILVVFNAKNLTVSIELEIETRFRKLQSEIQKSNHLSRDQKMVSSSCEHLK